MKYMNNNEDIVWKVVIGHHSVFSKKLGDNKILIDTLFPIFKKYNV